MTQGSDGSETLDQSSDMLSISSDDDGQLANRVASLEISSLSGPLFESVVPAQTSGSKFRAAPCSVERRIDAEDGAARNALAPSIEETIAQYMARVDWKETKLGELYAMLEATFGTLPAQTLEKAKDIACEKILQTASGKVGRRRSRRAGGNCGAQKSADDTSQPPPQPSATHVDPTTESSLRGGGRPGGPAGATSSSVIEESAPLGKYIPKAQESRTAIAKDGTPVCLC